MNDLIMICEAEIILKCLSYIHLWKISRYLLQLFHRMLKEYETNVIEKRLFKLQKRK